VAVRPEVVAEAVRLKLIEPEDADRFLAVPAEPPPDRPFDGRLWTKGRRIAYAIASASSGMVAQLPPRPVPPPSGRGGERMPSPKRRRSKGVRS
jgi:hypothetical protein